MSNLPLPFDADPPATASLADDQAREVAVDPRRNVVLEASAGTGKTRVLVDRYLNLLAAGVDPANIIAITFTRKAAAEMRQRIVSRLRQAAAAPGAPAGRWRELRDRLGEITISTIDAFCLSLLREFPLEADLDPGFELADETEVPRLVEAALDRTLRIGRGLSRDDEAVALVFAELGESKLREGLATLLDRRLVASDALARFVGSAPRDLTAELACTQAAARLRDVLAGVRGGVDRFLADGPVRHPRYALLVRDIRRVLDLDSAASEIEPFEVRAIADRIRDHFYTLDNTPRKRGVLYARDDAPSPEAWTRHNAAVVALAPLVGDALAALQRDLNVVLARGVSRLFQISLREYRQTLEAHAVLDFPEVLGRTLDLLSQMDEFAQSRYRLESRYQHVLVDEFQDTSRAQWQLVAHLVAAWGEGLGLSAEGALPPSIFIVGDRKQSIYGWRDAEVAVLEQAARHIEALRLEAGARRAIARSFRAVPALLAFTNDLFAAVEKVSGRDDAFRYDESDRFPVAETLERAEALGIVAAESEERAAEAVAGEIERLLAGRVAVRDRESGLAREITPADVAVLFRSRESHREFEAALEAQGIPAYVYKGLGFYDADEIKDVVALWRYLADPASDLRAAAFLRSRFVRVSDAALQILAPDLASALIGPPPPPFDRLDAEDRRVIAHVRETLPRWLARVDRIPPAELLDEILGESAYWMEIRGPRRLQARENLKKVRALVRRLQNRGYATVGRIAAHLDRLSGGDESNAIVDAIDAVHLMTVHAAKGLEFPVVFVVNLQKGASGRRAPIRVEAGGDDTPGGRGPGMREDPGVAVGDFQSDRDEAARGRAQEETKRLLYVAVTRARDRLYLASVLENGEMRPRPGGLGAVVPESIRALFGRAARCEISMIEWTGERAAHHFQICTICSGGGGAGPAASRRMVTDSPPAMLDDFGPVAAVAGADVEGRPAHPSGRNQRRGDGV